MLLGKLCNCTGAFDFSREATMYLEDVNYGGLSICHIHDLDVPLTDFELSHIEQR